MMVLSLMPVSYTHLTKVQRERYFSLDEMEEESYSPIDDFYDEEEIGRAHV